MNRPHPNVVQFIGISFHELAAVIVTEFLAGGSLDDAMMKNDYSVPMIIKILNQIAAGMFHLAEESIVHRDLAGNRNETFKKLMNFLKARNCLLSETLEVKVSDFGMSRFTEEDRMHKSKALTGPLVS
jgi:serine/threonine protein kinase